jgi:hypothetical protein
MKLLVRPSPFIDESLIGYLIRLTESNGYSSPNNILGLLPSREIFLNARGLIIKRKSAEPPDRTFQELARLVQKDPGVVSKLRSLNFADQQDNRVEIDLNRFLQKEHPHKFCPACLKERAYHRKLWNCILITVCPKHKCLLHMNCPNCKGAISLNRKYVCFCQCKFDLRSAQRVKVVNRDTRVASHIFQSFSPHGRSIIPESHILFNYSITEFCSIIYYFCKRIFRLYFNRPIHVSQISSQETLHETVTGALSLFDAFPKNYLKLLNVAVRDGQYLRYDNEFKYFSWFHPNFYRTIPPSCAAFLYKAFNANINRILRATKQAPVLIRVNTDQKVDNVIGQLGFHNSHFLKFLKEGIIHQSSKHKFDAEFFIKTMTKLRSMKKPERCTEHECHVAFRDIVSLFSNDEERAHSFLRSVFQGKIMYCYEDFRLAGFNRFFFDRQDLDGL